MCTTVWECSWCKLLTHFSFILDPGSVQAIPQSTPLPKCTAVAPSVINDNSQLSVAELLDQNTPHKQVWMHNETHHCHRAPAVYDYSAIVFSVDVAIGHQHGLCFDTSSNCNRECQWYCEVRWLGEPFAWLWNGWSVFVCMLVTMCRGSWETYIVSWVFFPVDLPTSGGLMEGKTLNYGMCRRWGFHAKEFSKVLLTGTACWHWRLDDVAGVPVHQGTLMASTPSITSRVKAQP